MVVPAVCQPRVDAAPLRAHDVGDRRGLETGVPGQVAAQHDAGLPLSGPAQNSELRSEEVRVLVILQVGLQRGPIARLRAAGVQLLLAGDRQVAVAEVPGVAARQRAGVR